MTIRLRPPPSALACRNPRSLPAGATLHRTHAAAFRAAQFNPCLGQPTRFAPFDDQAGGCVATLYAATSREAAVFESIFYDIEASAQFKTVQQDVVESRAVSQIRCNRALRLVGLFAPDLKAWGFERSELIDTPKSTYDQTVLWAAALHQAEPAADGLIWTSRQCDPEQCMVLFGDRITEADCTIVEQCPIATNPSLLLELRGFGRRAGIAIVA